MTCLVGGNEDFWREFIELYKSLPEVWQLTNDKYKDRKRKSEAYDILADKLREIKVKADRHYVTRKINTLRGSYRRELKKVLQNEKMGREYVPSLWYYDDLDAFLRDQVCQTVTEEGTTTSNKSISNASLDYEETTSSEYNNLEFVNVHDESDEDCKACPKIQNNVTMERTPVVSSPTRAAPTSSKKVLFAPTDDSEIFGKCWAAEYRKLDAEQQLFAKRTIDEVLFQARLGRLHEDSSKIDCN